jgi:hypothetical protein
MGIERACADIWRIGQFRFRKFLGIELIAKRFSHSSECTLPRFGLKRDVPRAFELISDDALAASRRLGAVGRTSIEG